jgi:hypothetical protein
MKDELIVTGNHVLASPDGKEALKQLIAQRVGYRKRTFGIQRYGG